MIKFKATLDLLAHFVLAGLFSLLVVYFGVLVPAAEADQLLLIQAIVLLALLTEGILKVFYQGHKSVSTSGLSWMMMFGVLFIVIKTDFPIVYSFM